MTADAARQRYLRARALLEATAHSCERLLDAMRDERVALQNADTAAVNGAVTAPEFKPSIRAATDEAWQRRVQWSTLLVSKP